MSQQYKPTYEQLVEENKTLRNLVIRLKEEATSTIEILSRELEALQASQKSGQKGRRRPPKPPGSSDVDSTEERKPTSFNNHQKLIDHEMMVFQVNV